MKNTLKVMLFILTLCVLLGFVLTYSQNTDCDLMSLLLQDNMMPSGWERLWRVLPPALPKDGAQDAVEVIYKNKSEIAHHTVYRYKNGFRSFTFYRINDEVFFPSGSWIWSELDGSDDWILNGDEAKIQCGDSDDPLLGFKCDAVIRYDQYISEFSSPVSEGIMGYQEFKSIVLSLDNQIVSCIQKPKNYR